MLYFTRQGSECRADDLPNSPTSAWIAPLMNFSAPCQPVKLERKPLELLILLTSRQGQLVTRTEIAEHLWSSEIFVDTEHGINTAVRKLRITLRDDPAEPKFIKTVTGIGYRFVAPVAIEPGPQSGEIEDAANFNLLPPPVDSAPLPIQSPSADSQPIPAHSRRSWWMISAAALLLLVGLSVLRFRHRAATPAITSLAVIPLDNFSADPGQEYLADGMTDELTTMIARNSTLRVTSRTSVMQYKGARRPLSEIAHSLGVDAIVEGFHRPQRQPDSHDPSVDQGRHRFAPLGAKLRSRYRRHPARRGSRPSDRPATATAQKPVAVTPRSINAAAHDAYLKGRYLWPQR